MIGETIRSYRITTKLGAGGMGDVFRATDTRLGREVAIKFSSERFSDRFEREARAVAALNHPNICTLYDVGPSYLVMELVEGPTLAERIVEGAIPLGRRSVSRDRLPRGSRKRTRRASPIGISNPAVSRSSPTARSSSRIRPRRMASASWR